jgi:hypothetical protein
LETLTVLLDAAQQAHTSWWPVWPLASRLLDGKLLILRLLIAAKKTETWQLMGVLSLTIMHQLGAVLARVPLLHGVLKPVGDVN